MSSNLLACPNFQPGAFVPPRQPVNATTALRDEISALKQKLLEAEDSTAHARLEAEGQACGCEAMETRLQHEAEDRAAWEKIAQELDTERAKVANSLAALQAEAETAPVSRLPNW